MARIRVTPAVSRKIKAVLYEKCGPPERYEEAAALRGIRGPNARTLIRWIEGDLTYINESSLVPFTQTLDISFPEFIAELEAATESEQVSQSGEAGQSEQAAQPDSPVQEEQPSQDVPEGEQHEIRGRTSLLVKSQWIAVGITVLVGVILISISFLSKHESPPVISLLSESGDRVDPDSAFVSLSYHQEAEDLRIRCNIGDKYEWETTIAPVSKLRLPLIGAAAYQCTMQVDGANLNERHKISESISFRTLDVERPTLHIPGNEYSNDVSWYQAGVTQQSLALPSPGATQHGNVLYFDGQYAWVADRALYDFNKSSFTIYLALNIAETKEAHLISKVPNNPNRDSSWAIVLDDRPEYREDHNVRVCFVNPYPGAEVLCASKLLDTKTWYTVAFSYNFEKGTYIWYINGRPVDVKKKQIHIANTNTSLFLGVQEGNLHHSLFKGELRDLRIYKSVISPERIWLFHTVFQGTL